MNQARAWLEAASSVVVLTGAGISAESGVPTFRGQGEATPFSSGLDRSLRGRAGELLPQWIA
ncbi:MAG TPA: hypothetical protein VN893_06345 [Bryobacteraceae bacterium]|nr:hypothetical protein [Bryobacteraceae bacterium]